MKTRGNKRQVNGVVVSNKMDKTVVVQVERLVKHPLYKKYIRRRNKFMAHDTENACQIGDRVEITESRPLSKTKRWRVSRILEKAV
jgi:small subunit ribosomal protein S17